MTFASVLESTQLWRKGREFTVAYLLGDKYKDEAERYAGDLQLGSTRLPSIPFAYGGQDWRDDLSLGNVSPLILKPFVRREPHNICAYRQPAIRACDDGWHLKYINAKELNNGDDSLFFLSMEIVVLVLLDLSGITSGDHSTYQKRCDNEH